MPATAPPNQPFLTTILNLERDWDNKRTRALARQQWALAIECDCALSVLLKVREEYVAHNLQPKGDQSNADL